MRKALKIKWFLIFLFLTNQSKGQVKTDSSYIKQHKMYVGVYHSSNYSELTFNTKWILNYDHSNKSIKYRPNAHRKIGGFVGYKSIVARFAFHTEQGDSKHYGTTKQKSLELFYIKPRSVFELTYNSYDGMYHKKNKIRSDISTKAFFMRYHYIFNGSKFSYKASFGMGEQQLQPATTWLLYANVAWYKVNSDATLLTKRIPKPYNLTGFKRKGASFGGGYAAALGTNRMFASIFANIGLKLSDGNHQLDSGSIHDGLRVSPNLNIRVSFVYNTGHLGAAMIIRGDYNVYKIEDLYVVHNYEILSLVAFYKFRGPDFLEKIKVFKKKK